MKILLPAAFDIDGIMLIQAEKATESYSLSCIRDTIRNQDIHEESTQLELTEHLRGFLGVKSIMLNGVVNHNCRIKRLVVGEEANGEIKYQHFKESINQEVLDKDYVEQLTWASLTPKLWRSCLECQGTPRTASFSSPSFSKIVKLV